MIARADGSVLYNFAVAVDDAEMGITDVIRGDDHLSNTPKQLLVLEALGVRRRRATPTCRCSTAPTARSSRSATAPPRSRSCARRATCRPRSATTWRCSAGAPTTTRRCSAPTSSSSGSRSSASAARRRSSTSRSCAGSTAATCASWTSTDYARRSPRTSPASGRRRGARRRPRALRAEACAIVQEKAQTLDEVWPLIALPVQRPGDDEKALAEGDEAAETAPRSRRRVAALEADRRSRVRRRDARARRCAPLIERLGVGAARPAADPGRDHGSTVSPGDLRDRSPRSAASGRSARVDRGAAVAAAV